MRTRTAAEPDPYVVLGVPRTATDAQIREAYRALGARYHPDRHQGNPLEELAGAKMAEINRAYETLSDPARRASYDRSDSTAGGPSNGAAEFHPHKVTPRGKATLTLLLVALPLLLRFGGLLVRGLVGLAEAVIEAAATLRGTPAGLVLVIVAAIGLGFAIIRQRRRRNRR